MSAASPRLLFVSHACYLDDSSGAAVACRELMQAMARRGLACEALSGSMLDLRAPVDPTAWLAEGESEAVAVRRDDGGVGGGSRSEEFPISRLVVGGVPVTIHFGAGLRDREPDEVEVRDFLKLFDATIERFRPDVVVGYGGNRLQREVFATARRRGIATVFELHNFQYFDPVTFADVDVARVPSFFAAGWYHGLLGIGCAVLPNLVDRRRVACERRDEEFITFVNPAPEKGVFAFARIADELGRRRPDVRILVVEGRGTEATVAACGLDLRERGNVFFMSHTRDPRLFYQVSRVVMMPSLWWENQPLVAIEAMLNGIPVVGSDRGGLPETLGAAGVVLPLPDRLGPTTRLLPTPDETAPWVDALIRLWDDAELRREHRERALAEARRWDPRVLTPRYVEFFKRPHPGSSPFDAWRPNATL